MFLIHNSSKEITLAKAKKITTEKNMNFIFISNILLKIF